MADPISQHFQDLPDPRSHFGKRHVLTDMLTLTVCAVICGADGWAEVEDFGQAKVDWLRTFLKLPHGIPSHDTLGRVFARLDPQALETCFMSWFKHLAKINRGQLIAIDGKTLRRSFDTVSHKALGVRQAIEAVGADLWYLPPYSPDFNPIEKLWSKVKAGLRRVGAKTFDTLTHAIGDALRDVQPNECNNYFNSCGYQNCLR